MNANRLQLNATKTEFVMCSTPTTTPDSNQSADCRPVVVASVDSVRDLGLHLNSDMSTKGGSRRLNCGATRGSGSPSGVQGQSPGSGSGDGVPQIAEAEVFL